MRNMDLASKKYWDLSNLSILKHEKRSWFTVTMKRIAIPCKTGSAATRNGDFFRTTWDLDSQKEVSNHQQSVREFTTWELFGVGPPPTSLPLSVRLAEDWMCLGGKNSIGNHGFYSCVHSWKMCENWVCNHAIRYWYDLAVSEMGMPAGHFKREMMINQRMEWGTQFSGKPT